MASLSEYFARTGYKAVWSIGDRIIGNWNDIPFVGTVGNDTQLNEVDGPYISVCLDLPIKFEGKVYNHIRAKHKDVRLLKCIKE